MLENASSERRPFILCKSAWGLRRPSARLSSWNLFFLEPGRGLLFPGKLSSSGKRRRRLALVDELVLASIVSALRP